MPAVINDKLLEMGTLVQVLEISQVYEDGKMDIKTRGIQVFRILEIISELPEKLYSGAIVNYPENEEKGKKPLMKKVINGIRELHKILKIKKEFKKPDDELWSYDIAHHAGLSLSEEYELLELLHESQRQEYLRRHLAKVLPMMADMEILRERVKLNGHFRRIGGGSNK